MTTLIEKLAVSVTREPTARPDKRAMKVEVPKPTAVNPPQNTGFMATPSRSGK